MLYSNPLFLDEEVGPPVWPGGAFVGGAGPGVKVFFGWGRSLAFIRGDAAEKRHKEKTLFRVGPKICHF